MAYAILSNIVIDWYSLFFNSFWILGLALIFASLSYEQWEAKQRRTSFRDCLNKPAFLKAFWAGFILISIGLAGTSGRLWETTIWCFFLVIGFINLVRLSTQL